MITITINTENDAFGQTNEETAEEIAKILDKASTKFRTDSSTPYNNPTLQDSNGNTVGAIKVKD